MERVSMSNESNKLQWRTDRPGKDDLPGIWALTDAEPPKDAQAYSTSPQAAWRYYCRVYDMPVIEPPVVYRDVDIADIGHEVEVSDDGFEWQSRRLWGMVIPSWLNVHALSSGSR
jgi:hypothetical protein